jgi:nickel-dependent lactate racemase
MRVRLDYDRRGLEVYLPDRNVAQVLSLAPTQAAADPSAAVRAALLAPHGCPPLRDLARGRRTACVAVSDVTRPAPNAVMLPPLLAEIETGGIRWSDILILVATGLHRPNEGEELRSMVGDAVWNLYRIENHNARDRAAHRDLGRTAQGLPALVDARFVEADLRVVTGLTEPHFMAGYSGGRKAVCPGLCAAETICAFHSPRFIEHERSAAGVLDGNPTHEAALEMARLARVDFCVNAVMNERRELVAVSAGGLEPAFEAAVRHARAVCEATVREPADIVVTSSAGHPLDTTWYQAIKAVVVCLPAVKPGGTIIVAAGIREGLGSAEFSRLCRETPDLEAFMQGLRAPGRLTLDQWELEELALARRRANVMLYTDGLDRDTQGLLHVEPVDSVEDGVARCLGRYGPDASLIAIPKGPYVLPVRPGPQ